MTVGAQLKSCYYTIKQIDAGLETLASKSSNEESKEAFLEAQEYMQNIKYELEKQIIFIENEEPQYNS